MGESDGDDVSSEKTPRQEAIERVRARHVDYLKAATDEQVGKLVSTQFETVGVALERLVAALRESLPRRFR